MPDQTTKWDVPYSTGSDGVDSIDETMQDLAERLDVLLGETGSSAITPSGSDVSTALAVNYSRTYPTIPRVHLSPSFGGLSASVGCHVWVSGETTTGFQLNIRSTNTSARTVLWSARPVPA